MKTAMTTFCTLLVTATLIGIAGCESVERATSSVERAAESAARSAESAERAADAADRTTDAADRTADKTGDVAEETGERMGVTGGERQNSASQNSGDKAFLNELPPTVYDFAPGGSVIFEDDFSQYEVGSMPRTWRSSGTGTVMEGGNLPPGRWLHLAKGNAYRILDLPELPQNFTISFDLFFDLESIRGAAGGGFGLARNNQLGEHGYGNNVAWITLEGTWWWRHNSIGFGGEDKSKSTTEFPTSNYAGRTMRVEIQITNGNWMKVFLDQYKIADTDVMYPESAKYFYINGPSDLGGRYDRLYLGNVRIAE